MITRRTIVGAGLAFTAVASTAGFGMTARRRDAGSIDALLIDQNIEMPRPIAALLNTRRRTLPVVGIHLDAAAQAKLMRVLAESQTIAGLSSGATLFCLERMGWDHGFRLTGRSEHCTSSPNVSGPSLDTCRQELTALLSGAAHPSALARAYRPSRADGMLHLWVMQKSGRPQFHQRLREV